MRQHHWTGGNIVGHKGIISKHEATSLDRREHSGTLGYIPKHEATSLDRREHSWTLGYIPKHEATSLDRREHRGPRGYIPKHEATSLDTRVGLNAGINKKSSQRTILRGPRCDLHVVSLAEKSILVQGELLSSRQLALAGVAGETRQVIQVIPRLTHPVGRAEWSVTLGTLPRTRPAQKINKYVDVVNNYIDDCD